MAFPTTLQPGDTRLRLWKKILGKFQNVVGSIAHNNPKPGDTLRMTMVKVLRAIKGI